jgi:hypothetical protein
MVHVTTEKSFTLTTITTGAHFKLGSVEYAISYKLFRFYVEHVIGQCLAAFYSYWAIAKENILRDWIIPPQSKDSFDGRFLAHSNTSRAEGAEAAIYEDTRAVNLTHRTCKILRPCAHQGNWQPQHSRDFRERIADFKHATGFQICRRTLRKIMFE